MATRADGEILLPRVTQEIHRVRGPLSQPSTNSVGTSVARQNDMVPKKVFGAGAKLPANRPFVALGNREVTAPEKRAGACPAVPPAASTMPPRAP